VSSVAIVYFSGYGHTAKQAEAVRKGAASAACAKVKIYRISETGDLLEGAFEEIWIGTGLLPSNTKTHGPADVNWTAGFGGALAVSPSDASPEEAPRAGDLETARLLGKRVAEFAERLA
jgi:hypothetical protein